MDLNGDNLWFYRACLQISDHCRVTVRVWVRGTVAACCIQTAGEMQINHVIKTDQWHAATLHILSCPFVVLKFDVNLTR